MLHRLTKRHQWATVLACGLAIVAGCGDDEDGGGVTGGSGGAPTGGSGGVSSGGSATGGVAAGGGGAGGAAMLPFELTSTAYSEGDVIPTSYECGPPIVAMGPGQNVSPPLAWTPGPAETMSYAIVMRDIDAAVPVIHWVLYDIPATALAIPEGVPIGYDVPNPAGTKQAELQGALHTYLGPCSPNSINTYVITVHAMDVATLPGVVQDTPEANVANIIETTSIASASLSGES